MTKFCQMSLLVQIKILYVAKKKKNYVSIYLKLILFIHVAVFLVFWWGRSVKRSTKNVIWKCSNKYKVSLAQNSLVLWSMEWCFGVVLQYAFFD